ncbi:MAG: hypothetical protein HQK92_01515 [Nitrospirae bacterium]|nr:hypothetical protein [Nitrospirota bacterium]
MKEILKYIVVLSVVITFSDTTVTECADNSTIANPFGFHPASVYKSGYSGGAFDAANDLGLKWTRETVYAYWSVIQQKISVKQYDFSLLDKQYGAVPAGINILGNITAHDLTSTGYTKTGSYVPSDTTTYVDFVKAVVERYDGDGIHDMPGLKNPVKYWQVDNEPSLEIANGFATLQQITYDAIKAVCSDCTVLMGGVPGTPPADTYLQDFKKNYKPFITELNGNYVDAFDFHWYGNATGDYKGIKDVYNTIRQTLDDAGFTSAPIWITELGSYSGKPSDEDYSQTETQQASDYVKRYVYALSLGIKKVFVAFGIIEGFKNTDSYFDHTGVIYDGVGTNDLGVGVKKLAYYAYKKMVETLNGCDWSTTEEVLQDNNIYVYRVLRNNNPLYIAWNDSGNSKYVTISETGYSTAKVTKAVPPYLNGANVVSYNSAFSSETHNFQGGTVSVSVGQVPVYIELN